MVASSHPASTEARNSAPIARPRRGAQRQRDEGLERWQLVGRIGDDGEAVGDAVAPDEHHRLVGADRDRAGEVGVERHVPVSLDRGIGELRRGDHGDDVAVQHLQRRVPSPSESFNSPSSDGREIVDRDRDGELGRVALQQLDPTAGRALRVERGREPLLGLDPLADDVPRRHEVGDRPVVVAERCELEVDPDQLVADPADLHVVADGLAAGGPLDRRRGPGPGTRVTTDHQRASQNGRPSTSSGSMPAASSGARFASTTVPSGGEHADEGEEVVDEAAEELSAALHRALAFEPLGDVDTGADVARVVTVRAEPWPAPRLDPAPRTVVAAHPGLAVEHGAVADGSLELGRATRRRRRGGSACSTAIAIMSSRDIAKKSHIVWFTQIRAAVAVVLPHEHRQLIGHRAEPLLALEERQLRRAPLGLVAEHQREVAGGRHGHREHVEPATHRVRTLLEAQRLASECDAGRTCRSSAARARAPNSSAVRPAASARPVISSNRAFTSTKR